MAGFLSNIMDKLSGLERQKIDKYSPESMVVKGPDNKIRKIEQDFDKAYEFHYDNRDWEDRNWLMYSGFEDGQWTKEAAAKLKGEGRHVAQYNFTRSKVDGLAGSLIKNWFDLDFVPVDGQHSTLTEIMKELFYADKELMNWKSAYGDIVVDGLVYRGAAQMRIDDRYNALGNIGIERVMPGSLVVDPNWITNESRDIKKLYKVTFMTPEEIMWLYKHKTDEVMAEVDFLGKVSSRTYYIGDETRGFPYYDLEERVLERKYRVIENHYIKREKKSVEIDVKTGTIIPEGTDESKRDFCIKSGIDCSEGIIEKDYDYDVYYVSTIAPQLSRNMLLEDRKHEIQIGRLPFFLWSSGRINGKDSGIVDLISDTQQTINKRESLIDHMIATSANGGAGVDPQIVGNNPAKMDNLRKNWNNPAFKFFTEPGALASGRNYWQEMPKSPFPSDMVNELNRMTDYLDRLSKQPAASDARSEAAHETGILFARKQLQASIGQETINKSLERFWNDLGEAYFLVAQKLYSGAYREFNKADNTGKVEVNEIVETPFGEYTRNDIAKIPRHKVVVTQSPEGVTVRATNRAINAELLRSLPEGSLASRAMLTKDIMSSLDKKDEDRQKLEVTSDLEFQVAVETLKTQIMGMKAQQAQMQAQLAQQQQPALPAGGEGEQQPQAEPGAQPGQEIPLQ